MHPRADSIDPARFRLLGGAEAVDDAAVRELYGYPDALSRPLVRGNAVASLDGAATTGGTSGGLGGPGDRWLFAVLREVADVIVVGAGTAREENYGGVRMTAAQRQSRLLRGQPEVPPIALVTRSGQLRPDLPVLTDSGATPLILTCTATAGGVRRRLGSAAEVLDCSAADPDAVDLGTAVARLAERGLLRILTEGGPSLLGGLIARGLLDELCLTTAPMLVGGTAVRIVKVPAEALSRMRRAHVLTDDDGYLYARYARMG